jgi:hypothetical protein
MSSSVREGAASSFPVLCGTFQQLLQAILESINRLTRVRSPDLRTNQPTVDIEIRLGNDGSRHRLIALLGQSHAGIQHGPVSQAAQRTNLRTRVVGTAG